MRARTSLIALAALASLATRAASGVPPADCPGDCDGDRRVGVDELIRASAIALGRLAPDACGSLDADSSGTLSIDELVRAVAASIAGCPAAASPTPSPTASDTATPSETPGVSPTPSPTASPTQLALGLRRFSIDPKSSPLTAVLANSEASTLPGFSGFLDLAAGEPDAKSGLAFIAVTDASEYIAIDIPAEPAALCIRPVREALPVERAGIVACKGGLPAGFASRQDHRIGIVGFCVGGNGEGSTCQGDEECPGGRCFDAAACEEGGGRVEGPEEPHPGVCNGPPEVGLLAGDAGPGAVWIVPGLPGDTQGLPVEILTENATPCGDEDAPGASALLTLISATVEVAVDDANDASGTSLVRAIGGEAFSCANWREENGPGTLVFGAPGLDVRAVGGEPMDVLTFFVLDD